MLTMKFLWPIIGALVGGLFGFGVYKLYHCAGGG